MQVAQPVNCNFTWLEIVSIGEKNVGTQFTGTSFDITWGCFEWTFEKEKNQKGNFRRDG
jgi:hypothetical protein